MSKFFARLLAYLAIAIVIIAVITLLTALFPVQEDKLTLSEVFSVIEQYAGNDGYIVSSFYVYEDDSSITVYMVYNADNELIYQFPEWTIEKDLG